MKTKQIGLRLSEDLLQQIELICKETNFKTHEYIRLAIVEKVLKDKKKYNFNKDSLVKRCNERRSKKKNE